MEGEERGTAREGLNPCLFYNGDIHLALLRGSFIGMKFPQAVFIKRCPYEAERKGEREKFFGTGVGEREYMLNIRNERAS